MLPADRESDRFLIAKETKLVGYRRGKFVFCYVLGICTFRLEFTKPAVRAKRGEFNERADFVEKLFLDRNTLC